VGEWKKYKASDFIDFNPRENISKGTLAKKVAMDKLQPFTRNIPGFEVEPFNGGSKFRNGDTIMARITPCLENGKTAKVSILDDGEVGFGSTEFIVLRAKPGVSDENFIYYLAQSPILRDKAIKSMVGSSGRQRVQQGVLNDTEFFAPPLEEQRRIGQILSALDDKIEENNKINHNLEQTARAIFKSWFVDFEPFGGIMPGGWQDGTFSNIITETIGGDWGKGNPIGNNSEEAYCIRGADIPDVVVGNKGKMPVRYILPKNYQFKQLVAGDIVVEISGGSPTQSTGRCALITQSLLDRYDRGMVCTNFCRAIKPKSGYSAFVYYYLQHLYSQNVMFGYENGTTGIKNFDISGFITTEPIIIPPIETVLNFEKTVGTLIDGIFTNGFDSEKLANTRDNLLPQLMSGSLSVNA
jgi:type I restriction enzyme S subunit